ncbi:hypothetical protein DPX16_2655 [Anabarilius grahami]|uniref:Uncharacterized protein n=1 Tax=Anabarilius grahami TaxID=495550 RepID=A0A3N0Y4M0_ANAGA|nr:hypothetical protein DPX16_2655 [Anabarilius grahami]
MKLIFGLMLLKTAACLEFNCSFYQKDPCYAALGDKLNLKMLDASKYTLKIKKKITSTQDHSVCRVKDGRIKENECDLFNNRPEVSVINGILIINGVIRADSGTYRLEVDLRNSTDTADLQVIVEESQKRILHRRERVRVTAVGQEQLKPVRRDGHPREQNSA